MTRSEQSTGAMDRQRDKVFWSSKRIWGSSLLGILALVIIYTAVTSLGASTLNVDSRRLTLSKVERGPFQEFIPVSGNVLPIQTVYLETLTGGRVEEVFLEEGTLVRAGDEVLRLANTDLQLDTMRREDQLLEQINQLINTRQQMQRQARDFEKEKAALNFQIAKQKRLKTRDEALYARELISRLDYELSRDEYDYLLEERERLLAAEGEDKRFREEQIKQVEEAVERGRRNLSLVQQKYSNLVIRAPISGQLTALDAEIGQTKEPGERLAQIDVIGDFKIHAEIDQIYLNRIQVGQTGEFDLQGTTYTVQITKIYSDITDGKFEVDLEVVGDEQIQGIKRGQSLRIRLALGDLSEVVYLEKGAFFQRTGGQWIYVVDETSKTATKRRIRIGRQNPDSYEVLEGLEPGEEVIISTYENFSDFEKLVLKP